MPRSSGGGSRPRLSRLHCSNRQETWLERVTAQPSRLATLQAEERLVRQETITAEVVELAAGARPLAKKDQLKRRWAGNRARLSLALRPSHGSTAFRSWIRPAERLICGVELPKRSAREPALGVTDIADVRDALLIAETRHAHTANYGTSSTGFRLSSPGGDKSGPDIRLTPQPRPCRYAGSDPQV